MLVSVIGNFTVGRHRYKPRPAARTLDAFMAVTVVPHSLPTLDPPSHPPSAVVPRSPAPAGLPTGGAVVPVSATLAANEAMARRRQAGEPVLPLAFGEAGLPVPPALQDALSAVTGGNDYGPVAGRPELRAAAAVAAIVPRSANSRSSRSRCKSSIRLAYPQGQLSVLVLMYIRVHAGQRYWQLHGRPAPLQTSPRSKDA